MRLARAHGVPPSQLFSASQDGLLGTMGGTYWYPYIKVWRWSLGKLLLSKPDFSNETYYTALPSKEMSDSIRLYHFSKLIPRAARLQEINLLRLAENAKCQMPLGICVSHHFYFPQITYH